MFAPAASADQAACHDARLAYRSAVQELSRVLQDYAQCLKASHGEDDCGVPFVDVESAQKEIEAAVSRIRDDCR
jgi:hypothetical protein